MISNLLMYNTIDHGTAQCIGSDGYSAVRIV